MWIYLLKFSALLAIFLVFYKIFLEKATMHHFKRFYLLGAFAIALCIPLITFTEYVQVVSHPLQTAAVQSTTIAGSTPIIEEPINYIPYILWGLYGLGVVLFTCKFLINLSGVIHRIRKNPKEAYGPFKHVLLQDNVAPHTFFSYVFFNKNKYESQQIPKEVFWHEETHAKQKHSVDIMLLELLQIVFWFHPLIYIAKHFIKLNHEFLADEAVLHKGVTTSTYQKILLAFSLNLPEPSLSNSINYSSIKKRIIIMKTQTSKKALWLKSLLLLPLLALLLYSFSDRKIVELENTKNSEATNQLLITTETQTTNGQDIEILINRYGHIMVNSFLVKMEDLSSFLLKYNQDLNKEERSQTVRSIITIDSDTPKKIIKEVEAKLVDYGVATINIQGRTDADQEKGATKAEIKEYNALAGKYNNQAKGKYVIKTSDMSRLKQLYDRMTIEQKASAEPYPNFPPPPPPAGAPKAPKVIKNSELPPLPPLPANAPEAERIEYEKTVKIHKQGNPGLVYDHKTEDGENIEVVVITDENNIAPPPPPLSPAQEFAKLAKQGAKFYLNGKAISSEEAIKITEKNKEININIEGVDSEPPMVKITTKAKKD